MVTHGNNHHFGTVKISAEMFLDFSGGFSMVLPLKIHVSAWSVSVFLYAPFGNQVESPRTCLELSGY